VAKERGPLPVLRQPTPTNFIAGPLGVIACHGDTLLISSQISNQTFPLKLNKLKK
jgi:hypothetical protein